MYNNYFENFQYNSCVSRGICSINPRISALQTVMVLYLRLFALYAKSLKLKSDIKDFFLNTLAITINNLEFNENSFLSAVKNFKEILPRLMNDYVQIESNVSLESEIKKLNELLNGTEDVISAIRFGEKVFNKAQKNIKADIRDLYNIMLVIAKSLSINLLDLESFDKENKRALEEIFRLLVSINFGEKDVEKLKSIIYEASQVDNELLNGIYEAQIERYGEQREVEVSFSTTPGKAVLVVGSNIRELEIILDVLQEEEIDVYTHDDMMLAHTFSKFSLYSKLKGQFGFGLENCLLDFATFPGPIILTKHSLHNIENLYRGRLFTTDYMTSPKGVIKIKDKDFSDVIKSAIQSRGFKRGKQCESINVGFDYEKIAQNITSKLDTGSYQKIFLIGLDGYSLEQKVYFEKLFKLVSKDVLILSFSYKSEEENVININGCFDYYSLIRVFNFVSNFNMPIITFIPKCERSSISQMIYLSKFKNVQIYVGKCTPIILNPSLMHTLQVIFDIKSMTSVRNDLEVIM